MSMVRNFGVILGQTLNLFVQNFIILCSGVSFKLNLILILIQLFPIDMVTV
jgi:hypothetical protein